LFLLNYFLFFEPIPRGTPRLCRAGAGPICTRILAPYKRQSHRNGVERTVNNWLLRLPVRLLRPERLFRCAVRVCIYTPDTLDTVDTSVYLYTMKSQDIIKALKADGWEQVAQKGSHVQFKHPTKPGRVTVPHPNKDVPIGTLRSIEKQAATKLR
jgi:predicted RNA binding protein YcfA (HicA-like mRNA interferase family)